MQPVMAIKYSRSCIEPMSVEEVCSRMRNSEDIAESNGGRNKYSLPAYLQSIIVVPSYSSSGKQHRLRQ